MSEAEMATTLSITSSPEAISASTLVGWRGRDLAVFGDHRAARASRR